MELLAVLLILSILLVFLLPRLGGMREAVQAHATRAFMVGQLAAAIGEYVNEKGDYPPSSWNEAWGPQPNPMNLGAEALFLALWSPPFDGRGFDEGRLVNTDGDSTQKGVTSLGTKALFELADEWGNPIAYFHHRDYDRTDLYVTLDGRTGEPVESTVKALQNPASRSHYNRASYQLISAGEDGIFGTADDLTNFKRSD